MIEYGNHLSLGGGSWNVADNKRVTLVRHVGTDAGAGFVKNDLGAPAERRNDLRNVLRKK